MVPPAERPPFPLPEPEPGGKVGAELEVEDEEEGAGRVGLGLLGRDAVEVMMTVVLDCSGVVGLGFGLVGEGESEVVGDGGGGGDDGLDVGSGLGEDGGADVGGWLGSLVGGFEGSLDGGGGVGDGWLVGGSLGFVGSLEVVGGGAEVGGCDVSGFVVGLGGSDVGIPPPPAIVSTLHVLVPSGCLCFAFAGFSMMYQNNHLPVDMAAILDQLRPSPSAVYPCQLLSRPRLVSAWSGPRSVVPRRLLARLFSSVSP